MTSRQQQPDDRPPAKGQPDQAIGSLISQPYVAEILAALDEGPRSLAGLRRATGASRRLIVAALHALAAHQAIAREPDAGSWDSVDQEQASFRLTAAGQTLIEHLFHLETWWATFAVHSPSGE